MHLALPTHKTMLEQTGPGLLAALVVLAGFVLIPVHYPLHVTEGRITPDIVRPGDQVKIEWRQEWRDLCPITVTREFVGADSFRKIAATLENQPPKARGVIPYSGTLVVPDLPPGDAFYHSVIQPHCWIDALWQRTYRTPEVAVMVVKATPPGPR